MEISTINKIAELQNKIRLLLSQRGSGVLELIDEHHRLSEINESEENTGESYVNYALYYSMIELNHEKFTYFIEKAKTYFDLNNKRRSAYFYGNAAYCYQQHSMMPETQTFFLRAIDAMEQIPDRSEAETRRLAAHYYNLYILFGFSDLGTLDKRYIDRALELNTTVNNKLGISYNYSALVNDYDRIGKKSEALDFALKRIDIVEGLNDPYQLGLAYCSAGLMYAKLGDRPLSTQYFEKANAILFPTSHHIYQAGYYLEIAEAFLVFEEYDRAIESYQHALKIYEVTGSTLNSSRAYRLMSKAYKHIGDFDNALIYQEKYSQTLLDSFKLDKLLAVTATEHEYEQKQQQIETEMLKQKNAEINMYVKQLEQSNEDLKQFAHAASHDLREPVRAIVSYASLLEMSLRGRLTAEEKEYLVYLKEGGRRMYDMVTGILAFSKVNNVQDIVDVDTNAVYHLAIENIKLALAARKAVVEAPDLPVVKGNSTLLMQLFQNLISNAIKYNESEIPTVRITVSRQGDMYQFCVSDNGIGIEDKHKDDVFDIFTRLHNQEQYQGTGIGLSICRKIVERLGGEIWNQPSEMGGTDFKFTLLAAS